MKDVRCFIMQEAIKFDLMRSHAVKKGDNAAGNTDLFSLHPGKHQHHWSRKQKK
jgi:hypothetical protein